MAQLGGLHALRRFALAPEREWVWRWLTTPPRAIAAFENLSWSEASAVAGVCAMAVYVLRWLAVRYWLRPAVVILEFATYQPPAANRVSRDDFRRMQRVMGCYTADSLQFMDKMIERTGLGDATYAPDGALATPPELTITRAREESSAVMFDVIERVLRATGTAAASIDILIVNCSLFNPTPSLAAMVINRFALKPDIQSYNLSGMGCSAGVISIHLAKQLLQVHREATALVVSTENLTQAWYRGNQRDMLLPNALFRVGGAAILLSNKYRDRSRGQYRLLHTVRTHLGADDTAYNCIYQTEDAEGVVGVRLTRDIARVASRALRYNLTELAPKVLPYSELAKALGSRLWIALKRRTGFTRAHRGPEPIPTVTHTAATKSSSEASKELPPKAPAPALAQSAAVSATSVAATPWPTVPVTVQSPARARARAASIAVTAATPVTPVTPCNNPNTLTNALIAVTRRVRSADPSATAKPTAPPIATDGDTRTPRGNSGTAESPLSISGAPSPTAEADSGSSGNRDDRDDRDDRGKEPGGGDGGSGDGQERAYVPDFTKCVQHFCIHAGGRGVLDALQRGLKLSDAAMRASRDTLERYGNTSSSSIWYELDVHRRSGVMRRGDRVWQLAFGSGFKCNSAVWETL